MDCCAWSLKDRPLQDHTRSTQEWDMSAIEQPAPPLKGQDDDTPSSQSPQCSEMEIQESSSSNVDSEAIEELPSYEDDEVEEFHLCPVDIADLEGWGEENSNAEETENPLPASEPTSTEPTGQVNSNMPEGQMPNAVPLVGDAEPTHMPNTMPDSMPLGQHGHSHQTSYLGNMCFIPFVVAMVIFLLAGRLATPSSSTSSGSAFVTAVFPVPTRDPPLSPSTGNQSAGNFLPGDLLVHIGQASLDNAAPKSEVSLDTSIAIVYRFNWVCKALSRSKNGIASALPKVLFSLPLPPQRTCTVAPHPPSHVAITSLALYVPTYNSVYKSPVAAAHARINWGDHPACPAPPLSKDNHTSILTCNDSSHTDSQTKWPNAADIATHSSALGRRVTKGSALVYAFSMLYSVVGYWYVVRFFLTFVDHLQLRPVGKKLLRQQKRGKKRSHGRREGSRQPTGATKGFTSISVSFGQRICHYLEYIYTVVCSAVEWMGSQCTLTILDYFRRGGSDVSTSEDVHQEGITGLNSHHTNSQTCSNCPSTQDGMTHSDQRDTPRGSYPQGDSAPDSHQSTSDQSVESSPPYPSVQGHNTPDHHGVQESPTPYPSMQGPYPSVQGHNTPDHHNVKSLPSENSNSIETSSDEEEASGDLATSTDTSTSPHTPHTEQVGQPCSQKTEQSPNHTTDESTATSAARDSQKPSPTVAHLLTRLMAILAHILPWKRRQRDRRAMSWIVFLFGAAINVILSPLSAILPWLKRQYYSRTAVSGVRSEGGSTETEGECDTRSSIPCSHPLVQEGTTESNLTSEQNQTEEDNHASTREGVEQWQAHDSDRSAQDGAKRGAPRCRQNDDNYLVTEDGTLQSPMQEGTTEDNLTSKKDQTEEDSHVSTQEGVEIGQGSRHPGQNHDSDHSAQDGAEHGTSCCGQNEDNCFETGDGASQNAMCNSNPCGHLLAQEETTKGSKQNQTEEDNHALTQEEVEQGSFHSGQTRDSNQDGTDHSTPHCEKNETKDRTSQNQDNQHSAGNDIEHDSLHSRQTQVEHDYQSVLDTSEQGSLHSKQRLDDERELGCLTPQQNLRVVMFAVTNQVSGDNQPTPQCDNPLVIAPQTVGHSSFHTPQQDIGPLLSLRDQVDPMESLSRGPAPGNGSPSQLIVGATFQVKPAMYNPTNPLVYHSTSPIQSGGECTKTELVCGRPSESTSSELLATCTWLQQQLHSSSTTAMSTSPTLQSGKEGMGDTEVKEPYLQDASSGHHFEEKELPPLADCQVSPLSSSNREPKSELTSDEMEEQPQLVPRVTCNPIQDLGNACSGELVSGTKERDPSGSCLLQDTGEGREYEGEKISKERTQETEEEEEEGGVKMGKGEEVVEEGKEGGIQEREEDEQMDSCKEISPNTTSANVKITYSDGDLEPLTTAGEERQILLAHSVHKGQWKTRQRLITSDTHKNASGVDQGQLEAAELAAETQDTHNPTPPTSTHDDSVFTSVAAPRSQQTGLKPHVTECSGERRPKASTATMDSGFGSKTNTASLHLKDDHLRPMPKHPPDGALLPPTASGSTETLVRLEEDVQEHNNTGYPLTSQLFTANSSTPPVLLAGPGGPDKGDYTGRPTNHEAVASSPVHGSSKSEAAVREETTTYPSSSNAALAVVQHISPLYTHGSVPSDVVVQSPTQMFTTSGLLVGSSFYSHNPTLKKLSQEGNVNIPPFDLLVQSFTILPDSSAPPELCGYLEQYPPLPLPPPQPLYGAPVQYSVPGFFLAPAEAEVSLEQLDEQGYR